MKSKKLLAIAGITMSADLLLAACNKAEKKSDKKNLSEITFSNF